MLNFNIFTHTKKLKNEYLKAKMVVCGTNC